MEQQQEGASQSSVCLYKKVGQEMASRLSTIAPTTWE
jgi:hypothetical protein